MRDRIEDPGKTGFTIKIKKMSKPNIFSIAKLFLKNGNRISISNFFFKGKVTMVLNVA